MCRYGSERRKRHFERGQLGEHKQMTIEQAIDLLDNLIGMIDDNHGNDYDTALKMAIKALEESVTDNDT